MGTYSLKKRTNHSEKVDIYQKNGQNRTEKQPKSIPLVISQSEPYKF